MHGIIGTVVVSTALSLTLNAQRPTDSEVEAVIKCGRGEARCDRPILYPRWYFLGLRIEVVPPLGRVYLAAQGAKERYLKFTRADVTEEMLAPVVEVRAWNVDSDMRNTTEVKHIVVLPRRRKQGAVQPTRIEDWNYEAKNLMGASFTRIGKAAYFNVSELPPGELDVVIVTDTWGEIRGPVDRQNRAKLDAWCGVRAGLPPTPR